jgi:hypothetical protein
MGGVLDVVLDPLAAEDELVLDGIGVVDHEPDGRPVRKREM